MNINKYTEKAQEAILGAQQLADREGHPEITPEHLLLTLLEQRDGIVPEIVRKMNADPAALAAAVRTELGQAARARTAARRSTLSARLRQVTTRGGAGSRAAQGRVRQHRAPAGRDCRRRRAARPSARILQARGITRDAILQALTSIRGSQRVTSQNPEATYQALERYGRDLTELAAQGQARSGDRPRRGDPPRHPGAVAPHQEQPGADRRAGRRQDGHRRRAGAAHRPRGRARGAEEQADRRARHGRADRRREVPRRVRGAAQGGPQGSRRRRRAGHPLHRRAAHRRRRRRGGRGDGRLQHAQADARARRAAHHRRDDARRVPQAHREGRGARAALPAGHGRRADGRGHDQHPARPARALRDPPRREVQGLGAGRRGGALEPLHHRPVPARQGDRPDRRGGVAAAHGDRLACRRSSTRSQRRIMQLEIEREALRKETDKPSKERLQKLEKELADLKEEKDRLAAHWQQEKDAIQAGARAEGRARAGPRSRSSRRSAPATTPRRPSCSTGELPDVERAHPGAGGTPRRASRRASGCSRRRSTRRTSPRSSAAGRTSRSAA